jgi:hypothetical protein
MTIKLFSIDEIYFHCDLRPGLGTNYFTAGLIFGGAFFMLNGIRLKAKYVSFMWHSHLSSSMKQVFWVLILVYLKPFDIVIVV